MNSFVNMIGNNGVGASGGVMEGLEEKNSKEEKRK